MSNIPFERLTRLIGKSCSPQDLNPAVSLFLYFEIEILGSTMYGVVFTEIPAQRIVSEQQRISNLLAIGRVPKAEFVIADAVQKYREMRDTKVDKDAVEKEDALLDLLVFLAGKRERAALFSVVA